MKIKIICKNEMGEEILFSYNWPFWLEEATGLFNASSDIITVKNALTDGELYSGISTQRRNIVITAYIKQDYKQVRDKLESIFAPHSTGTLTYYDKDFYRSINYYAENFEFAWRGKLRTIIISLICPDPLFRGEPMYYYMIETKGLIHFPINVSKPFQVANYNRHELVNVINNTRAEQGLLFRITTRLSEQPKNFYPEIANVNTGERIRLDTDKLTQGLEVGDCIEISTVFGDKYVDVIRGNNRTRMNSMWTAGNTWIQAHKGDNVFRLSTQNTTSENAFNLIIIYTPTYWRV